MLHFSHDRANWSSPSFSSIIFQNFPDNSHLIVRHVNGSQNTTVFIVLYCIVLYCIVLPQGYRFRVLRVIIRPSKEPTQDYSIHAIRDLLHAVNLRRGADGFTSPPKEVVMKDFFALKNQKASVGFEPLDHVSRSTRQIFMKFDIRGFFGNQ